MAHDGECTSESSALDHEYVWGVVIIYTLGVHHDQGAYLLFGFSDLNWCISCTTYKKKIYIIKSEISTGNWY